MRWLIAVLLGAAACGGDRPGSDAPAGDTGSAANAAPATARNACRLLTADDVKALEPAVVMANVVAEEPGYSECNWEDKDGVVLMGLKVYWTGGKQQWETWRVAQGMGENIMRQQEGIGLDSIVKQGVVPGLGDAAYFSPLLPSLLLKGDVLVELMMPTVKNPEAKFRPLATRILQRI